MLLQTKIVGETASVARELGDYGEVFKRDSIACAR